MLDITVPRLFASQSKTVLQFESDDEYQEWRKDHTWTDEHCLVRVWSKSVEGYEFVLFIDAAYGHMDYLFYKCPKDSQFRVRSVDRDGMFGERIHDFYIEGDEDIKGRHDAVFGKFAVNVYKLHKVRV